MLVQAATVIVKPTMDYFLVTAFEGARALGRSPSHCCASHTLIPLLNAHFLTISVLSLVPAQ